MGLQSGIDRTSYCPASKWSSVVNLTRCSYIKAQTCRVQPPNTDQYMETTINRNQKIYSNIYNIDKSSQIKEEMDDYYRV